MKPITIFTANCRGNRMNSSYPNRVEVNCAEDLKQAAKLDHVCADYKDADLIRKREDGSTYTVKVIRHRSNNDFIIADCLPADCDNDDSEDPKAWKTPADVARDLPGVAFYAIPSKSHNKEKPDGDTGRSYSPRPRYHYYFVIDPVDTWQAYRALKEKLRLICPYFDPGAKDAARFLFGVEQPEVIEQPGDLTLSDFLKTIPDQTDQSKAAAGSKRGSKAEEFMREKSEHDQILQGKRHTTLCSFAARVLKKCGDQNGKAYEAFMKMAAKCVPPLDDQELISIWNSASRFYAEQIAADPAYVPPEEYDLAGMLQPEHFTDVDEAAILWAEYCDMLRFTESTGWIVYNGTVWKESEAQAHGCMHDLTKRQIEAIADKKAKTFEAFEAAAEAYNAAQFDQNIPKPEKAMLKYAAKKAEAACDVIELEEKFYLKNRGSNTIKNVLTEARTLHEIDVAQLDANPFLLNTPAGTIDLKSGAIYEHNPYDFCTKITNVSPGTEGADLFREFLERITGGDQDLQHYLQQAAGMFAVGAVYRENLVIAYGSGGNGKSTLFNLLAKVLGDYSGGLSAETLTAQCRKNKSPELAELRGKRLVIAAELEEGMRLDTAIVKKLCSTDPIMAEKKYFAPFQFIPAHTVVLYTNHLPKVGTTDKGTWDRLIVVPFTANLRGSSSEILNYAEHLYDHAGGAVLSWIIEGARQFIANNFKIELPGCVRAAIDNYRDANNWLEQFIDECCDIGATYNQPSGKLYEEYRLYCDRTGDYKRGSADFKAAIESAGFEAHKTKKGIVYYGLRLKPDEGFISSEGFEPYHGKTPWDAA